MSGGFSTLVTFLHYRREADRHHKEEDRNVEEHEKDPGENLPDADKFQPKKL